MSGSDESVVLVWVTRPLFSDVVEFVLEHQRGYYEFVDLKYSHWNYGWHFPTDAFQVPGFVELQCQHWPPHPFQNFLLWPHLSLKKTVNILELMKKWISKTTNFNDSHLKMSSAGTPSENTMWSSMKVTNDGKCDASCLLMSSAVKILRHFWPLSLYSSQYLNPFKFDTPKFNIH